MTLSYSTLYPEVEQQHFAYFSSPFDKRIHLSNSQHQKVQMLKADAHITGWPQAASHSCSEYNDFLSLLRNLPHLRKFQWHHPHSAAVPADQQSLPDISDKMESVQRRATRMIRGLEELPCEEKLRELGLCSLEKMRLKQNLIPMDQYTKGGYQEGGDSLFTRSPMEKTRADGGQVATGEIPIELQKKMFPCENSQTSESCPKGNRHFLGSARLRLESQTGPDDPCGPF